MTEYFVNIKVDREERPDVDRMYMTFLQVCDATYPRPGSRQITDRKATSGGGGWPMSICKSPFR
jgi:uncharacterized protein YyaL (SSP411 family)